MIRATKASLLTATAFLGGLLAGTTVVSAASQQDGRYQGLSTLATTLHTIERHHTEPPARTALIYGAIRGMVDQLDAHSAFWSPAEYQAQQERIDGHFLGVGITLADHPDGVTVEQVLEQSPASIAGIEQGDIILAVDGEDVVGATSDQVAELLPGPRNTPVVLELQRAGQTQHVTVLRDDVIEVRVSGSLFEPGWAYLRIELFDRNVADDVSRILSRLERESSGVLQGLVLDLRGNPGGLLEEAVAVVDLFVEEGTILQTHGPGDQLLDALSASAQPTDLDLALVVLIDEGSASASEVVAGALQQLDRAQVVGTPSYGKGSVQKNYEFEDGSALRLTVASYRAAGTLEIHRGVGVQPDIQAERAPTEQPELVALREALTRLELPPELQTSLNQQLAEVAALLPEGPPAPPSAGALVTDQLATDRQLQAAWKALRPQP